jgi:hypothetical protein
VLHFAGLYENVVAFAGHNSTYSLPVQIAFQMFPFLCPSFFELTAQGSKLFQLHRPGSSFQNMSRQNVYCGVVLAIVRMPHKHPEIRDRYPIA